MPAVQSTQPQAEARVPEEAHAAAILVVEDEMLIRAALSEYLRAWGYRVLEACHAEEAMAILTSETPVDLVFSDVRMPGSMDGLALAQWIRCNRPEIPVLLTSGDMRHPCAGEEICRDGPFFAKPYDMNELARQIGIVLAAQKVRAA